MGKWATLMHEHDAALEWRSLVVERCAKLGHPPADMDSGARICPCGRRMEMVIEHKTYRLPASAVKW